MNDLTEFLLDRLGVPPQGSRTFTVRLAFHGIKPLKGVMREVKVDEVDWPELRALVAAEAAPERDPEGAMRSVLHAIESAEADAASALTEGPVTDS